ncbi:Uncharacterised protein [Candidatus Gugararchaeum adminiculabundum]|nr:Uncharacterised protein [Candidatus Gugararchaeum adminiculabundum]
MVGKLVPRGDTKGNAPTLNHVLNRMADASISTGRVLFLNGEFPVNALLNRFQVGVERSRRTIYLGGRVVEYGGRRGIEMYFASNTNIIDTPLFYMMGEIQDQGSSHGIVGTKRFVLDSHHVETRQFDAVPLEILEKFKGCGYSNLLRLAAAFNLPKSFALPQDTPELSGVQEAQLPPVSTTALVPVHGAITAPENPSILAKLAKLNPKRLSNAEKMWLTYVNASGSNNLAVDISEGLGPEAPVKTHIIPIFLEAEGSKRLSPLLRTTNADVLFLEMSSDRVRPLAIADPDLLKIALDFLKAAGIEFSATGEASLVFLPGINTNINFGSFGGVNIYDDPRIIISNVGFSIRIKKGYIELEESLETRRLADFMNMFLENMEKLGEFLSDVKNPALKSWESKNPFKIILQPLPCEWISNTEMQLRIITILRKDEPGEDANYWLTTLLNAGSYGKFIANYGDGDNIERFGSYLLDKSGASAKIQVDLSKEGLDADYFAMRWFTVRATGRKGELEKIQDAFENSPAGLLHTGLWNDEQR